MYNIRSCERLTSLGTAVHAAVSLSWPSGSTWPAPVCSSTSTVDGKKEAASAVHATLSLLIHSVVKIYRARYTDSLCFMNSLKQNSQTFFHLQVFLFL